MKNLISFFIIFLIILNSCNNREQSDDSIAYTEKQYKIESLLKQSEQYYNQNEYMKAYLIYKKIIRIDSTLGEAYFKKGNCEAQLFLYDWSTKDYFKAIELGYRIDDAYFNLGLNYGIIKKDTLALTYFLKANEISPNNKDFKMLVSIYKKRLGMFSLKKNQTHVK
jgi:tetratricopeptide (TPR) repeat protein